MSLAIIQQALQRLNRTISVQNWLTDEDVRSQNVEVIRRYINGNPDNFLTTAQRAMLNLPVSASIHQFSDNYCPAILSTILDRIQLIGIEADDETQQTWIDDLLSVNRLDELQGNEHEAALRDGNAFLMVDAIRVPDGTPNGKVQLRMTQEPAYDGYYGMVVMYETSASKQPLLACKVWRITTPNMGDTVRINVYYPNRVERYIGFIGGGLRPYGSDTNFDLFPVPNSEPAKPLSTDPASPTYPPGPDDDQPSVIPWVMEPGATVTTDSNGQYVVDGTPIGVPIIHFRNKGNNVTTHGIPHLQDVIPLQDLMNRTLYDMAATSALSAFGVRLMIGDKAPDTISPGLILSKFITDPNDPSKSMIPDSKGIEWLKSIRLEQFQQADLVPYINQLNWIRNEMFAITNTPEMENASANASGESLRQREVKLIGAVQRFEVRNGNAWEDAMRLCARVQEAFSGQKQELGTLNAKWADAEIRNDTTIQANALLLYTNGLIDQRQALELIQDIYDWDADDIDQIIASTEKARGQNQISAQDAQNVMDKLTRVQSGGAMANGASGGSTQDDAQNGQAAPVKAPPVKIAGTLSSSGAADTPGA